MLASLIITILSTMLGSHWPPVGLLLHPPTPPPHTTQATDGKTEQSDDEDVSCEHDDPVAELLTKLESSASDLHSFTADIRYETEDALLGQKVIRQGNLIYHINGDTKAREFAILFDTMIENRRRRQREKQYIFNNRWLVEVDPQEKVFIKREIVPPGQTFDPLKLGEGPFPLPIGQAKDEVLARFTVSLIDLPETGSLAKLRETTEVHGLKLLPKPDTSLADEYKSIELFYDKVTLLPVGINVIEINDNRKTARLEQVERNPELTEEQLKRLSVAEPDPTEWRIDVRPWESAPAE